MANFEAKPLAEQTVKTILATLERVSNEWKESRGERTKLALAAKAKEKAKKKELALANRAANQKNNGPGGGGAGGASSSSNPNDARDAKGNRLCNYCLKPGHIEKDRRTKQRDAKAGRLKKRDAGGGGSAGGAPQSGAFPPCIHCKKTNHPSEQCFFKDRATQKTGERAAANVVQGNPQASQLTTEVGKPLGDLNSVLAAVIAKKAGLVEP